MESNNPQPANKDNNMNPRSGKRGCSRLLSDKSLFVDPPDEEINLYDQDCAGPFSVFVKNVPTDADMPKKPLFIGDLHPMNLGRLLRKIDMNIEIIKRKGKNLVEIVYSRREDANNLIKNQKKLLPVCWKAFIPDSKVSRYGIAKDIPADLSIEEIEEGIHWECFTGTILKMERFQKKEFLKNGNTVLKPTNIIKIRFKGQKLPDKIKIWSTVVRIEAYEPKLRWCNKCLRVDHLERSCRGNLRCNKCGGDHNEKECKSLATKCINCKGDHKASDRSCPVWVKALIINKLRFQLNIDRKDAVKLAKVYQLNDIKSALSWIKNRKSITSETSGTLNNWFPDLPPTGNYQMNAYRPHKSREQEKDQRIFSFRGKTAFEVERENMKLTTKGVKEKKADDLAGRKISTQMMKVAPSDSNLPNSSKASADVRMEEDPPDPWEESAANQNMKERNHKTDQADIITDKLTENSTEKENTAQFVKSQLENIKDQSLKEINIIDKEKMMENMRKSLLNNPLRDITNKIN